MTNLISFTNARYGAWIVKIGQAFTGYPMEGDVSRFEQIIIASKYGKFLQTIVNDKERTIAAKQIAAYGRSSNLGHAKIQKAIKEFKRLGLIDYNEDMTEYRVISRDRVRVLDAVYKIFSDEGMAEDLEVMSIHLMEYLNIRPRSLEEIESYCSGLMIGQINDLKTILRAFDTYGIVVKIEDGNGRIIYYSIFQNSSNNYEGKIAELAKLIDPKIQEDLDKLVEQVYKVAGLLKDSCEAPAETIELAASLGLIEIVTVNSAGQSMGSADFVLPPSAKTKDVTHDTLEDDIFHNAKVLLSSIRFGEQKSLANRGRILDPVILMGRLIKDNEVGPCTAIGEDYGILETDGIIETTRATHKQGEQYYMNLRRREPALIVKRLLEQGFRKPGKSEDLIQDLAFPMSFNPPERYRIASGDKLNKSNAEARRQLVLELRTARYD